MPILDILDWISHRCKKREKEGGRKMLGRHFIWIKEDLEAVRENIADDGHCNIRGIGKVHQIITMPNKSNDVRAYSSNVLYAIIAHNHLALFKIFSNFVYFSPNFQIFCLFSTFLCHFSQKSLPMPLLYKIGPGCTY